MFKAGEKVVCVNASPVRTDCASAMPLKLTLNAVYTVASIHTEPGLDGYGVRLEELPNPSIVWSDGDEKEWSYDARRFRQLELKEKPIAEQITLAAARVKVSNVIIPRGVNRR